MNWRIDQGTLAFITQNPGNLNLVRFQNLFAHPQFNGDTINAINLLAKGRITDQDSAVFQTAPNGLISSPENIKWAFNNGHYLVALAMVVSWGNMKRTNHRIYASNLETINAALSDSSQNIQQTNEIRGAWNTLEEQLHWSNVMISKTLHFMCRALFEETDPNHPYEDMPVPIDNEVIMQEVWRFFILNIRRKNRPINWRNGLDGYEAYMTFINYLRETFYQNQTNTYVENAIFNSFPKSSYRTFINNQ